MYDFPDETMHLETSTAYSHSLHHPDIRNEKYQYKNTAQQIRFLVVRINQRSSGRTSSLQFLQFISYIIMPGSINVPKAKVLALHVHDSCVKMFLATIPAIHVIHHNARPISIPKAKVLLLALHVHDSYFKMLAKKIFLSTNLIKLKPRFSNDQSMSICVQRIYRSDWSLVARSLDLFPGFCLP